MLKRIIAFFKKLFRWGVTNPAKEIVNTVKKREIVIVGNLIRVCPGKRHAWFESNVGPIRKQL